MSCIVKENVSLLQINTQKLPPVSSLLHHCVLDKCVLCSPLSMLWGNVRYISTACGLSKVGTHADSVLESCKLAQQHTSPRHAHVLCGMQADDSEEAPMEEAQKMQVRRAVLEKWLNEPFLETTVVGCLVRMSVTGGYILAEVIGVVEREPGTYKCVPWSCTACMGGVNGMPWARQDRSVGIAIYCFFEGYALKSFVSVTGKQGVWVHIREPIHHLRGQTDKQVALAAARHRSKV